MLTQRALTWHVDRRILNEKLLGHLRFQAPRRKVLTMMAEQLPRALTRGLQRQLTGLV